MATKLVVTLEGLVLSNLKEIVSSRSIDEVILVGTPAEFNGLSDFTSITTAKTNIAAAKSGSTLSVAFNNNSSASLSEGFYDYLSANNISFFVDSELSSLSSSFIVEAENVTGSKINNTLNNFDDTTITNNIAYAGTGSTLTLGTAFGSKPTITTISNNFVEQ